MKWLFVVVVVARAAHADPFHSRSIAEGELTAALKALPTRTEEPTGVVALAKDHRLGLDKGDVVRLINGVDPTEWLDGEGYTSPIVWLDVARRDKPVAIRLQVNLAGFSSTLERSQLREEIRLLDTTDRELLTLVFAQATRDGKPSGVLSNSRPYNFRPLNWGDIIRKVNGAPVRTIEDYVTALKRAVDRPVLTIEADRHGQPVVATIKLVDAAAPRKAEEAITASTAQIKQLNDMCYEVPRPLIDAIGDALIATAQVGGVRLLPSSKDGASKGFKLQVLRPSPLLAKLGLANGDIVTSVNELDVRIANQRLLLFRSLESASAVTLALERGDKPLTYVYVLK